MCPQQYFCEYVLGWRGKGGLKADKGTIVHKVLEIMCLAKKAEQDGLSSFIDDVIGSVSSTSYDIDKITEQVYKYYSEGNPQHDWKEKDFKDCSKWVYKTLEMNDGIFDPRNRHVVDAEPHFDFEIDEDWGEYDYVLNGEKVKGRLALKGTIDLITKVEDGFYEIVDWKTGRRLDWATGKEKTYASLQNDPQLRIYHYAAMKLYPEAKQIMVTINYMNDGGAFSMYFSEKDISKTKEMLRRKFEQIKSTRIPMLKKSWKCTKLCHQGKSTFEGTSIHPMMENRHGERTSYGEYMTKCEQIKYEIERKGIQKVTEDYMAENHSVAKYKAPGSLE
tara:strand:- start:6675 stop:7673 length:999 start_codon:yes stop_codon:yes gene_type:complete